MQKKIIFLLFLLILTVFFSFSKSKEIYNYYNYIYYLKIKGQTQEQMYRRAYSIYKKGSYGAAGKYLFLIESFFPENLKIKRLAGLNMIAGGQKKNGATKILYAAEKGYSDERSLWIAISILYNDKLYTDIVSIYDKIGSAGGEKLIYMYGISCFKIGRYKEALKLLLESRDNGEKTIDLFYYLGLTEKKLKNYNKALKYMKYANKLRKRDKRITKELVILYKLIGKYEKAEKYIGK